MIPLLRSAGELYYHEDPPPAPNPAAVAKEQRLRDEHRKFQLQQERAN